MQNSIFYLKEAKKHIDISKILEVSDVYQNPSSVTGSAVRSFYGWDQHAGEYYFSITFQLMDNPVVYYYKEEAAVKKDHAALLETWRKFLEF